MESSINLAGVLETFFLHHGLGNQYIVGFSGGLDSTVLMALCQEIKKKLPIKLHAVHVHHNLSKHADHWAEHCKQFCDTHAIPFSLEKIAIRKQNKGIEAAARDARINVFEKYLQQPGNILLTAHHLDDQAETFLLQLLRGCGPKGLAAMPSVKPFGSGLHARPLLTCERKTLLRYANLHQLTWIDDESNDNLTLTRNIIRHKILPIIQNHFPAATRIISRSSRHIAEMQTLTATMALDELREIAGSKENTLSISRLKLLSFEKQRLLLRLWLDAQHIYSPNERKLLQIQSQMLQAKLDRQPQISFGGYTIRRYRDNMYLTKAQNTATYQNQLSNQPLIWEINQALHIPGVGLLKAKPTKNKGLRQDISKVTVVFREGGETISLYGRGRLSLKKLFQSWGVPPWERYKMPLLYFKDELIAVVGFYLHPLFTEKNGMGNEIKLTLYT